LENASQTSLLPYNSGSRLSKFIQHYCQIQQVCSFFLSDSAGFSRIWKPPLG